MTERKTRGFFPAGPAFDEEARATLAPGLAAELIWKETGFVRVSSVGEWLSSVLVPGSGAEARA